LAVPKVIDEKLADDYIKYVSEVRSIPVENLKGYSDMIKGSISYRTPAERVEWAARQAYIALGVLITSAAIMGIDTGPMEGFDAKKFDEILGLDKIGFESKVCIALGFRSESDEAAKYKKVRFTKDQVVLEK
jgi:nitroreductase